MPLVAEYLRPFLTDCSKYLVIGTSGRDGDLLGLLADSVGQKVDALHYVGFSDINDVAKRFGARVKAFEEARINQECDFLQWKNGFRGYVSSPDFDRFAAMDV